MTLKQFFSSKRDELATELQQANHNLKQEVEALRLLNLIAAEITVSQLAQGYRRRREELWRAAWSSYVGKEQELAAILETFYGLFRQG